MDSKAAVAETKKKPVPIVKGLPLVGNLMAFRRYRLIVFIRPGCRLEMFTT